MEDIEYTYDPEDEVDEDAPISTKEFISDLKHARLFSIIKSVIIIALIAGICVAFNYSLIVVLILLGLFLIIRKFVRVGSSMTYEYFDERTLTYEIGDHGFLSFLIGMVVIYAFCEGIVALDKMLFPEYFFIFELLVVAAIALWLASPIISAAYTVINSTILLKHPPKTEYFRFSEYKNDESIIKAQRLFKRIVTIICITAIGGALLAQAIQYFVMSPKLLAKLDRQAAYTEYAEQTLVPDIPSEEFEDPDDIEYGRFRSRRTDTYKFRKEANGFTADYTVTVTYAEEESSWKVTDHKIKRSIVSMNLSGTWNGTGEDKIGFDNTDQNDITIRLDKMTADDVTGKFTLVSSSGDSSYESTFKGSVAYDTVYDDEKHPTNVFVATVTLDDPRSSLWADYDQLEFIYYVDFNRIVINRDYPSVLEVK